jgi:hypothetical protein
MIALPHVKPLPKQQQYLLFYFSFSQTSVKAIGIEATVVLPYF